MLPNYFYYFFFQILIIPWRETRLDIISVTFKLWKCLYQMHMPKITSIFNHNLYQWWNECINCLIRKMFHFNDVILSLKIVTKALKLDHHLFDE